EVVEGAVEFADVKRLQPGVTLHAGDYALAAPGVPLEAKPIAGVGWWEVWVAGPATLSNDTPLPATTVYQDYLATLYTVEWSYPFISDWSKHYPERVRGFLTPEQNGDYIFWMMSEGGSEFWFSPDSLPGEKA